MRLATIKIENNETGRVEELAGIVTAKGIVPIRALNDARAAAFGVKGPGSDMPSLAFFGGIVPVMWEEQILPLIETGQLRDLTEWYNGGGKDELENIPGTIPFEEVVYAPLYRNPKRIFGIGLNYKDHAGDIGDKAPEGFPGSFFKMADTLIGPGDEIKLPKLKEATGTTAEAELGVIMAKECRDVSEENWRDVIAGFTTIIDMTEESILKGNKYLDGNPRYLTIVKNFPTFFSFGPQLVTPDEVPDVLELEVQSVLNGEVHAKNVVANMTHRPARLVSLHSSIQGWYPGDVLSTGTPRAFHIKEGDMAECRIVGPDGFAMEPLVNPVVDLKPEAERERDRETAEGGKASESAEGGKASENTEAPEGECLICGSPIEYLETEELMECEFCHKKENSRTRCINGHYVCDECHTAGIDAVIGICTGETSKDPVAIIEKMMAQPFCHMHGPEHHVMVGASLLTAYKNAGGDIDLEKALAEMISRGRSVPGGACGFWGACGAGISAGMFVSIISGSTPLAVEPFSLSNRMTSKALDEIGKAGGPRCCKRDSFLSIQAAVEFVKENFGISMESHGIKCGYTGLNEQCIKERCPFYNA